MSEREAAAALAASRRGRRRLIRRVPKTDPDGAARRQQQFQPFFSGLSRQMNTAPEQDRSACGQDRIRRRMMVIRSSAIPYSRR